jgi:spermidine synthase
MVAVSFFGGKEMRFSRSGVLLSIFALAGASSLTYETIWIRVLSLGVGSTSSSMSLVLAVFFLGLSAGSYFSGKWISRVKSPLSVYAAIECFIGLYALSILTPLFKLHHVLQWFSVGSSFSVFDIAIKFLLVATLLLPPTIAMGATLPILVRVFLVSGNSIGASTSVLYGINTLGAVLGAFVTAFFLIPHWGIYASNYFAVGINLLVALSVSWLARTHRTHMPEQSATKAAPSEMEPLSDHAKKAVLIACALSGFVSIASEVIWNKYLGIFFGTNIYGLGLILSLYLFGIAAGSLLLSAFIDRIRFPLTTFASLQTASILLVLVTSYALNLAPVATVYLNHYLEGVVSLLAIKCGVTVALVAIPTCVFGALFPLGIHLLSRSVESAPKWVGTAYAVNTLGAITGSLIAGMLLIPFAGSSGALKVISLVACAGAWYLIQAIPHSSHRKPLYGLLGAVVLWSIWGQHLNFQNLLKSAYHRPHTESKEPLEKALDVFRKDYETFKLIVEGVSGVISLSHDPKDGPSFQNYFRLKTNGLNESVYNRLRPELLPKYEALIGLLPYSLSPQARNAFIVGYGGGFTADLMTRFPIDKVHVVELESGILTAADFVHQGRNPVLERKNLNLKIEDARFMLATKQYHKQDIIISQPSHSWLSGAANLFTQDFFEIVKANLTESGVFSQWLNLYNMDTQVLSSILKTFFTVFPHGAVFTNIGDEELVLIGSLQPLRFQWDRLEALSNDPKFRDRLSEVPLQTPYDLLTHFSFDREQALKIAGSAPLNTDANAFAETHQSALFYQIDKNQTSPQVFLASAFQSGFGTLIPEAVQNNPAFLYKLLSSINHENQYSKFHTLLAEYENRFGSNTSQHWNLGYLCLKAERFESAAKYLSSALRNKPSVGVLNLLLSAYVEMGQPKKALDLRRKWPKLGDRITECYVADSGLSLGGPARIRSQVPKLVSDVNAYTEECGDYYNRIIGDFYFREGKTEIALPFLEAYSAAYPHDAEALRQQARGYQKQGDEKRASLFMDYSFDALERKKFFLSQASTYYRGQGLEADANALDEKRERLEAGVSFQ